MEGDKRPGRNEAAFNAEISGSAGQSRDIVSAGEGNKWYEQDIPHEQLVATIRELLAQDQEQTKVGNLKREEGRKFLLHPFWRLHFHLSRAEMNSPTKTKGDIVYLSPKGAYFRTLQNAWDAISYDHYPEGSEEKRQVGLGFQVYLAQEGYRGERPPVVLDDNRQIAVLDAMAEAVNIPHQRGQRVIPLPASIRYGSRGNR
jgi:hypothetical protein